MWVGAYLNIVSVRHPNLSCVMETLRYEFNGRYMRVMPTRHCFRKTTFRCRYIHKHLFKILETAFFLEWNQYHSSYGFKCCDSHYPLCCNYYILLHMRAWVFWPLHCIELEYNRIFARFHINLTHMSSNYSSLNLAILYI